MNYHRRYSNDRNIYWIIIKKRSIEVTQMKETSLETLLISIIADATWGQLRLMRVENFYRQQFANNNFVDKLSIAMRAEISEASSEIFSHR